MTEAKGRKGFTLVELIAALGILAIVAIPLTQLFMDSFKYQAKSQKNGEIAKMAEFVAEKFKTGDMGGMAIEGDSDIIGGHDLPTTNNYTAIIIIEKVIKSDESPTTKSADDADIVIEVDDILGVESDTPGRAKVKSENTIDNTAEIEIVSPFTGIVLISYGGDEKWSITIDNNQITGNPSIYTQRTNPNGKISIISTPGRPSIYIYDLGTEETTTEVQYAVYDVVIGVKEGNFDKTEMESGNWDYTLRTTLKKEIV